MGFAASPTGCCGIDRIFVFFTGFLLLIFERLFLDNSEKWLCPHFLTIDCLFDSVQEVVQSGTIVGFVFQTFCDKFFDFRTCEELDSANLFFFGLVFKLQFRRGSEGSLSCQQLEPDDSKCEDVGVWWKVLVR
jgi:hypothetical protein